uniref:Uncharacterized protein n=1 Tax=Eutreptiella gymnastica TaxID=73025 RepID=A0A7S4FZG1_9EUGL
MLNCVDTMDFVETLCALSRSTHAKLHRLWTDMGISTQCQNEAYRQLATRLQTICDNTIQEQEALEAKMCKDVAALSRQHQDLTTCLRSLDPSTEAEFEPAFNQDVDGLSLQQQHDRLTAKNTQLDQLRSRRVVLFTKLHAQLVALYNSLETPAPQRKPFARDKYFDGDNIGQPLLKAYEDEIQQCITQKRSADTQKIQTLIAAVRDLSTELNMPPNDECPVNGSLMLELSTDEALEAKVKELEAQLDNLKTEKQLRLSDKVSEVTARLRGLWKGYEDLTGHKLDVPLSEDISEAVYSDLTAKAADAEARIEAVSEATALLQRRNELLLEEAALIEALNDPGRLVSKQRGIAQQLLKEEKMRRALRVEMPKINAKLRRFATEWAEKHGEAFIYRGDVLLDVLPQPEPETAVLGTVTNFRSPSQSPCLVRKRPLEGPDFDQTPSKRPRYAPRSDSSCTVATTCSLSSSRSAGSRGGWSVGATPSKGTAPVRATPAKGTGSALARATPLKGTFKAPARVPLSCMRSKTPAPVRSHVATPVRSQSQAPAPVRSQTALRPGATNTRRSGGGQSAPARPALRAPDPFATPKRVPSRIPAQRTSIVPSKPAPLHNVPLAKH